MEIAPLSPLNAVFVVVFVGLVVCAAASDLRSLEIPNWLSVALVLIFLPAALAADISFTAIAIEYGVSIGIFAMGAMLFGFGLIGGGDVKFMAAMALWLHWSVLGTLFVYVALLGGVLAGIILLITKIQALLFVKKLIPWMNGDDAEPQSIPYGVAISGAGLIVLSQAQWAPFSLFG